MNRTVCCTSSAVGGAGTNEGIAQDASALVSARSTTIARIGLSKLEVMSPIAFDFEGRRLRVIWLGAVAEVPGRVAGSLTGLPYAPQGRAVIQYADTTERSTPALAATSVTVFRSFTLLQ